MHVFYSYLIQIWSVRVHLAISPCVLSYVYNGGLTMNALFHCPGTSVQATLSCRALCMGSRGKLSSEMRWLTHAEKCAWEVQRWCAATNSLQRFQQLQLRLQHRETRRRRMFQIDLLLQKGKGQDMFKNLWYDHGFVGLLFTSAQPAWPHRKASPSVSG